MGAEQPLAATREGMEIRKEAFSKILGVFVSPISSFDFS